MNEILRLEIAAEGSHMFNDFKSAFLGDPKRQTPGFFPIVSMSSLTKQLTM